MDLGPFADGREPMRKVKCFGYAVADLVVDAAVCVRLFDDVPSTTKKNAKMTFVKDHNDRLPLTKALS